MSKDDKNQCEHRDFCWSGKALCSVMNLFCVTFCPLPEILNRETRGSLKDLSVVCKWKQCSVARKSMEAICNQIVTRDSVSWIKVKCSQMFRRGFIRATCFWRKGQKLSAHPLQGPPCTHVRSPLGDFHSSSLTQWSHGEEPLASRILVRCFATDSKTATTVAECMSCAGDCPRVV